MSVSGGEKIGEAFAENQSGIFIGRCSEYVLREYTNAIHFFIHAPIDVRVERVCRYENLERGNAESIVQKRDKEREKYYNYYTAQKWGDVYNYDLSIDIGRIGLDEAVSVLEQYCPLKDEGKAYAKRLEAAGLMKKIGNFIYEQSTT